MNNFVKISLQNNYSSTNFDFIQYITEYELKKKKIWTHLFKMIIPSILIKNLLLKMGTRETYQDLHKKLLDKLRIPISILLIIQTNNIKMSYDLPSTPDLTLSFLQIKNFSQK